MSAKQFLVLTALGCTVTWLPTTAAAEHGGHNCRHGLHRPLRMPGQAKVPSSPWLMGKFLPRSRCHHHPARTVEEAYPADQQAFDPRGADTLF